MIIMEAHNSPFLQCVSMTKTRSRRNKASYYHSNLADKVVQSMKYEFAIQV